VSLSDLSSAISNLQFDPTFSLGAGLMAASGPSLMPHSFGQSLAQGVQMSQQARLAAVQAHMAQLQAQRYGMQNSAIAGVLGGGPSGQSQASAAAAQRMPAGTAPNAPMLSSSNGTPGTSYTDPSQSTPSQGSHLADGMAQDPMFKLGFAFDPSAASTQYLNRAYPQPTDFIKQLDAAGIDPNSSIGRQLIQQNIAKQNYIAPTSLRGGGYMFDPQNGGLTNLPTVSPGFQIIRSPVTGQFQEVPVSGGVQAVGAAEAAKAGAQAGAKAAVSPYSYTGPDGRTVNTTQMQYVGKVNPAFAGSVQQAESGGNPNAVSPAGAVGSMQTMPGTLQAPGFGVTPAQGNSPSEQQRVGTDYLGAMMQKYNGDPVSAAAAYNWGPGNFDAALQKSGGNVYAALAQAPKETQQYVQKVLSGALASPTGASDGAISGPSPGFTTGQETVAKTNAQRYQDVMNTGQNAASRMNVYDNLRGLLDAGVHTGYGTQWQNKAVSTIMNTPVLSSMIPESAKKGAIDYQVAMKYIAQGTLQRFQGQKGTGTDSQLEAVAHGNTNPEQLAGAMKTVSRYLESQDMADLAKANAQQAWASQNGYDYSKQDRFENDWREHNNPTVFQYKSADPAGRQEILQSLSKDQRVKLAHDMQFMSPFITTMPAANH
jgi:hypothetical protein